MEDELTGPFACRALALPSEHVFQPPTSPSNLFPVSAFGKKSKIFVICMLFWRILATYYVKYHFPWPLTPCNALEYWGQHVNLFEWVWDISLCRKKDKKSKIPKNDWENRGFFEILTV